MTRRTAHRAARALLTPILAGATLVAPPVPARAVTQLPPLTVDQVGHRLAREVFGYLPYWELDAGLDAYLRYDLLTTIAFFGIAINADGSLATTSSGYKAYTGDLATQVIANAHAAGVRTVITFTSFGLAKNAAFFANPAAQANFIGQALALMALRGADGANIDVELLDSAYFPAYAAFVGAFRGAAVAANPNAQVSVATNANTSGTQMAEAALSAGADRAFLMGYDYRWSGSTVSGAVAPFARADGGLSLTRSLDLYASAGVPLDRVILGLPYYGRTWPTVSGDLDAAVQTNTSLYGGSSAFYPKSLPASAAGATLDYDPLEQVARLVRYDTTKATWVQTYYDDASTLAPKIALTNARNMAGVGIWALGYDRGQPGFWDNIANAYGAGTVTSVTVTDAAPPDPQPDPNSTGGAPATPPPGVTNSPIVTVATTWLDGAGVPTASIRLSNDGVTWSAWQPVAPVVPWTLAAGPDGRRTVFVQVASQSGTVSPTASGTIVLDTAGPVATPPVMSPVLRGTLAAAGIPVRVSWTATDATTAVTGFAVDASSDGAPYARLATPPEATSTVVTVALGHAARFRVTPTDLATNVGAAAEGPTTTALGTDDRSTAVVLSAGWRRVGAAASWNGTSTYTSTKGASAGFRFTGRSITLLAPMGPGRGSARVLIDGIAVGAFSEFAVTNRSGQLVYVRAVAPGTHTIAIVASATLGHPRLDVDGFVVMR